MYSKWIKKNLSQQLFLVAGVKVKLKYTSSGHFTKMSEQSLFKQPCEILLLQPIPLCTIDNAFSLVRKPQTQTVTFLVKVVATGLEAVVVLATWSEPVKGLQADSCGLQQLWGLSSSSQQTDHSATALSWRVTTCTGQEIPCRLWVTQWLLHLNGHYLSLDLFLPLLLSCGFKCWYGRHIPFCMAEHETDLISQLITDSDIDSNSSICKVR